jgi:hypothetical protein
MNLNIQFLARSVEFYGHVRLREYLCILLFNIINSIFIYFFAVIGLKVGTSFLISNLFIYESANDIIIFFDNGFIDLNYLLCNSYSINLL